jgi:predicted DNA-binding ribbon-helix-helix protein
MRTTIIKRSIVIGGHKTSISLEDAFWRGLKDICEMRGVSLSAQVQAIDAERNGGSNLSSAVRLFVLDYFRTGAQVDSVPLAPAATPSMAPTAA